MPQPDELSRAVSPDDALPPVEPPSAGFIVQLFVVPMVIVVIIVAVYLMFNWLAQMGTDPQKHIAQIKRGGPASWQAAHDLATELRRDEKLRQNQAIALELAALLDHELTAGGLDEDPVNLRVFLCRSLGEFDGPEGVPALLKAVSAQADQEKARPVRRAAIESIAVLADKLRQPGESRPGLSPEDLGRVSDALEKASHDDDTIVQSTAAFALGVVGDETAKRRLRGLLNSAHTDVRFNAATGLARWGDEACLPVLLEMLGAEQLAATELEPATVGDSPTLKELLDKQARNLQHAQSTSEFLFIQTQVLINGLRASAMLSATNEVADLSELQAAVERLRAAPFNNPTPPLHVQAQPTEVEIQIRTGNPFASVQVELEKARQALSRRGEQNP